MSVEWKFEGRGLLSPEELALRAKDELKEDPKRTDSDIKAVREWFKKEPHLQGIAIGERSSEICKRKLFT